MFNLYDLLHKVLLSLPNLLVMCMLLHVLNRIQFSGSPLTLNAGIYLSTFHKGTGGFSWLSWGFHACSI